MPRPCASAENRRLMVEFAFACTTATGNSTHLIARAGPCSLFAAFAQCCPSAVRIAKSGARSAITELECNKELQTAGFVRVRDRRGAAKSLDEDPDGSGLYLFSGVLWRDPDDPEVLEQMLADWIHLRDKYPQFAVECPFDMFVDVVRMSSEAWKPKSEFQRKKRKTNNSFETDDSDVGTPTEQAVQPPAEQNLCENRRRLSDHDLWPMDPWECMMIPTTDHFQIEEQNLCEKKRRLSDIDLWTVDPFQALLDYEATTKSQPIAYEHFLPPPAGSFM